MSYTDFRSTTVLHPGTARGPILKLSEPLSFWGGFNPQDGRILDQSHPQAAQSIAGVVLAIPGSRGSAGTPAGIAEALRLGVGPAGILLLKSDVNIAIGAQVAGRLYGIFIPVLVISDVDFLQLQTGQIAHVAQGQISLSAV